ncbi:MAG: O-antigen ligase domain-containing protein [Tannerellaceae bacterium]|jgi:hypothetical protein|nr:O-antigen ligase domain-containing protein [Tannerellaceae bacterium]
MTQTYINKYFYALFLFTLTFGVLLYNFIVDNTGFDYTDEICALCLFLLFFTYLFRTKDWEINKAFLVTLGVFVFYLCYSLYIHSNAPAGILNDLFIQTKPYLAFFCVYSIAPRFDRHQKEVLKSVSLILWSVLFAVGVLDLFYPGMIWLLMSHETFYAAAVTITSLCYLYCSRFTALEKMTFLLLLSVGILSGRSKFYGFYALSVFMMLFFSDGRHFKWNIRNILIIACMFAAVVLVAWDKITFYFYQAVTGEVEEDMIARYVLYVTSPEILRDYFPFGSGLASYATYSSGVYYSHIYGDYGIDGVWGITKGYYSFIADAYYPSLAQFGVAGILLCLLFWFYVCRRAFYFYKKTGDLHMVIIIALIMGFLGIDGTTDSTFISNRGFFVMMLLGLVVSQMKSQHQEMKHKPEHEPEEVNTEHESIANQ